MAEKLKYPSPLLVVDRVALLASSISVTVAPGTRASAVSRTVPAIDEVVYAEAAATANKRKKPPRMDRHLHCRALLPAVDASSDVSGSAPKLDNPNRAGKIVTIDFNKIASKIQSLPIRLIR